MQHKEALTVIIHNVMPFNFKITKIRDIAKKRNECLNFRFITAQLFELFIKTNLRHDNLKELHVDNKII
jgi:hypothetical protein